MCRDYRQSTELHRQHCEHADLCSTGQRSAPDISVTKQSVDTSADRSKQAGRGQWTIRRRHGIAMATVKQHPIGNAWDVSHAFTIGIGKCWMEPGRVKAGR